MGWQFTPYALPLIAGAAMLFVMAYLTWPKRRLQGIIYYFWVCVVSNFYVIGYAFEISSTQLTDVQTWLKVQYIGNSVGVFLLFMVMAYAGYQRIMTRRFHILMLAVPTISVLLAWTNEFHSLTWTAIRLDQSNGFTGTFFNRGVWGFIQGVYAYVALTISLVLLVRLARQTSGLFRRQMRFILVATTSTMLLNLFYAAGLTPPGLDVTPYALVVGTAIIGIGIFRFQLFNVVPVAYQTILFELHDAIFIIDVHERIVDLNTAAQRILKRPKHEIIGQPASPTLDAFAQPSQTAFDLDTQRSTTHFEVHHQQLVSRQKLPAGRLLILRDVSEQRKLEQQRLALALERERTVILAKFIEKASHEFKTPLSIASVRLYLATKEKDALKKQERLTSVQEQLDAIDELVNGLVTLSRLDLEDSIALKSHNINHCITDTINSLHDKTVAKQISIQTGLTDNLPPVAIDQEQFATALRHLLDNAIQFSPSESMIRVETCHENDHVQIAVRDHGKGIDSDDQPHIFERFYRADRAHSTRGFGLGLAIAERIIHLHNGTITVESTPGEGSTFTIRVPIDQSEIQYSNSPQVLG